MPTGMRSGGFSRNAKPRSSVRMSGKPKTQKSASVSRMNSFMRALVSSTSAGRTPLPFALSIAELPSRQRDKEVLERRFVRRERAQLRAAPFDRPDELRHGVGERVDVDLPSLASAFAAMESDDLAESVGRDRRVAGELDDVRRFEARDQLSGRAEGDEVTVIDDGDAVAEALGFVHVVRGQKHRSAF